MKNGSAISNFVRRTIRTVTPALLTIVLLCANSAAAGSGILRGSVLDPMGASIANANVRLIRGDSTVATSTTDDFGRFDFSALEAGRYRVHVTAQGFSEQDSDPVYVSRSRVAEVTVSLRIGTILQQTVVLATGTPVPDSQVGASISTIPRFSVATEQDISQALRSVPGIQVLQTGQHGGTTDIFIRGGGPDANKVLLDGIPINDIGGRVEFGNLASTGIEQVEVLRGPNSVLYGADALVSVVSLTTKKGQTPLPEVTYIVDGGTFHTTRQEISIGGATRQFDYFSDFARFDTGNSVPDSEFHDATYAGNFGWSLAPSTQVRFTLRHTATALGLPNALDLYGIPDDSSQNEHDIYFGASVDIQSTSRWHSILRFSGTRLRFRFDNPTPTGQPFDPFGDGPNYLGNPVVLRGANGYIASGRAILDFGGDYPQLFNSQSSRTLVAAQSHYQFNRYWSGLLAFHYEKEQGFTHFAGSKTQADRDNFDYTVQVTGTTADRLYITVGAGVEKNAIFGIAATPRISVAYYLRPLHGSELFNGTKLRVNYGQGIKDPSIFDESTSLSALLAQLPSGGQIAAQFHVSPIGAERSNSVDAGVEQMAWSGRVKAGLDFFANRFSDQIEFVDSGALTQLGIPVVVAASAAFGASVNSGAFCALGIETDIQVELGHGWSARASYAYLDAVVERSFTGSALHPSFNPALPSIPIGNTPLVGNRPFRRAPHSGSFMLTYSHKRITASVNGNFVGRRDDSTHALDPFFGNSLLLPNRNLDAGYADVNLHAGIRVRSSLELFTNIENLLNQHYDAAFGFPSLPFSVRAGVRLTLGGESWKRH